MAIDPTTGATIPDTTQQAPTVAPPTNMTGGNFVNPAYATPQQVEQMRMYSYMLGKNAATMPVHRWTQGLGQIANSVMAGLVGSQADKESQDTLNAGRQEQGKFYGALSGMGQGDQQSNNMDSGNNATDAAKVFASSTVPDIGNGPAITDAGTKDWNAAKNYSDLKSLGATDNQAAMLTGNAFAESGFNPAALHDRGKDGVYAGYGLYGHQGDRLAAMQKMSGSDAPDAHAQNAFALQELNSRPENNLVNSAKTPQQLADAGMFYERPAGFSPKNPSSGSNYSQRLSAIAQAQQFADQNSKTAAALPPNASAFTAAPATAAINNSAPPPGQPPMVQALRAGTSAQPPGSPNPAIVAALRGGGQPNQQMAQAQPQMGGITPQDVGNLLSNPMISEEQKAAVRGAITPQTMPGLFGSQYMATLLGQMTGSSPRMTFNPGAVTTGKYGGQEIPQVSQVNPQTNQINTGLVVPGAGTSILPPNGSTPQPMTGGGSSNVAAVPPVIAPGTTGLEPKGPVDNLVGQGSQIAAHAALAPAILKDNMDAVGQSNTLVPQIQKHLQDINTFESILKSSTDGGKSLPLGALADKVQNWDSIAQTFGLGDKRVLESLELLRKNGELSAQDTYGTIPGVNGHATNDALASAHAASPSTGVSLGGNLNLIDELRRADQLKMQYNQERASALSQPGASVADFNNQWEKKIQSTDGAIPLSKLGYGSGTHTNPKTGEKIPVRKYPSTEPQGWSWFSPNDPRVQ